MKVSQLPMAQSISGTGNKVVVNVNGETSTVEAKTLVEAYAPQGPSSPADLSGYATEEYVNEKISQAIQNLLNGNITVNGNVQASGFIFPAFSGEPLYKLVANGSGEVGVEIV